MNAVKLQSVEAGAAETKGPDNVIQELQTEQLDQQRLSDLRDMATELGKDGTIDADDIDEIVKGIDMGTETISAEVRNAEKKLVLSIIRDYGKTVADGNTHIELKVGRTGRKGPKTYAAIADRNDGIIDWTDTHTEMLSSSAMKGLIEKVGLTPEEITTALGSRSKQEAYIASLRGQELQQAGDGNVAEAIAREDREIASQEEQTQVEQMARAKQDTDISPMEEIAIAERREAEEAEKIARGIESGISDMNYGDTIAQNNADMRAQELLQAQNQASDSNLIAKAQEAVARNQLIAKAQENGASDMNAGDRIAQETAMNQGELLPTQTLTEMATLIMKERGVTPENALALQQIANSFPSSVIQRILARSGGTSFKEDGIVGPQTRALNQYILNRSIPKEQIQALIGKDALVEDGINGTNTNKILAHLKTIDETTAIQYASNLNSNMSQFTA